MLTQELLPEGKYKGRIKEWGFSQSGNGKPRFEFTVRLGAFRGEGGEYQDLEEPVSRTVHLYLTDGAQKRSFSNLRALGYSEGGLERLDPNNTGPDGKPDYFDLHNVEVELELRHAEWNDKPKEEIQLAYGFSRKVSPAKLPGLSSVAAAFKEDQAKFASDAPKDEPQAPRRGRKRQAVPADDQGDHDTPF
jgi:hypothetical protein